MRPERGSEIARGLAPRPVVYGSLRNWTLKLKSTARMTQDVPFGMALEGLISATWPIN